MRKTSHTAGTKSYARWAEDLVNYLVLLNMLLCVSLDIFVPHVAVETR